MLHQAIDQDRYNRLFDFKKAADLIGTGIVDDPYPIWNALRDKAPVHRGCLAECIGLPPERRGVMSIAGVEFYTVFSFQAVSDVFVRKDDFSTEIYIDMGAAGRMGGNPFLVMDGPRHRRYRDVVQPLFQPTAAEDWWRKKVIDGVIEELLAAFRQDNAVELSEAFFSHIPLHTVTAGCGLTLEEGVRFREYTHGHDWRGSEEDDLPPAERLLHGLIRDRRANPRDDIISQVAQAEFDDDDGIRRQLTVEEIAPYFLHILAAGADTTWRQLGVTLFALLNNPDQLKAVIEDRSLINAAVLESARWYPVDPVFPRKVARDTVLHGTELKAGTGLNLCLSSANRDPARWEDPDRFDIFRPLQRSVAFGAGSHSCLGQHVSRQEMNMALNALFDHFPNIRWDPSKPASVLTGSLVQRGPDALHVLLD